MSLPSGALLGGFRVMEAEFTEGWVELTSVGATDNEEFSSVSGMSPPIRVVRFGAGFERRMLDSQSEVSTTIRPILCIYHPIAESYRSRFFRHGRNNEYEAKVKSPIEDGWSC